MFFFFFFHFLITALILFSEACPSYLYTLPDNLETYTHHFPCRRNFVSLSFLKPSARFPGLEKMSSSLSARFGIRGLGLYCRSLNNQFSRFFLYRDTYISSPIEIKQAPTLNPPPSIPDRTVLWLKVWLQGLKSLSFSEQKIIKLFRVP